MLKGTAAFTGLAAVQASDLAQPVPATPDAGPREMPAKVLPDVPGPPSAWLLARGRPPQPPGLPGAVPGPPNAPADAGTAPGRRPPAGRPRPPGSRPGCRSQPLGRAPHQHRVADRIGRRDQQQHPGVGRQRVQPPAEALLDPLRERQRIRWKKAASSTRNDPLDRAQL
jgi:hypothetical protein